MQVVGHDDPPVELYAIEMRAHPWPTLGDNASVLAEDHPVVLDAPEQMLSIECTNRHVLRARRRIIVARTT
jgi:hypothetical protein